MLCIKSVVLSNTETTQVGSPTPEKPRAGAVKLITLYMVKLYHANQNDSVLAFEVHSCLNKLLEIRTQTWLNIPSNSSQGLRRFPTKHVITLVVTVPGLRVDLIYISKLQANN